MREAAAVMILVAAGFNGMGVVYHLFSGGPSTEVVQPERPEDVLKYRSDSKPGSGKSGMFGIVLLALTGAAVGTAVVLFQQKAPVFAAATGAAQILVGITAFLFGSVFEYRDMIGIPAGALVVAAAASYWPDPNASPEPGQHKGHGAKRGK